MATKSGPTSSRGGRRLTRRRLLIATLAVPLAAAGVLAVEVELARRGQNLPEDPFDLDGRVGSGEGVPLAVVWLGDSTAAGVGATGRAGSLPHQVARRLGRPVDLTVLAVSGDRVGDVLADQVGDVSSLHPDLVMISVGANDVTHLTSANDFRRRYRDVLEALPAEADVVLLGVPDMGAPPRLAQPLRFVTGVRGGTLDAVVQELARDHNLAYVDIAGQTGPAFRRHPELFSADRYHPDDAGYEVWADAIVPVARDELDTE